MSAAPAGLERPTYFAPPGPAVLGRVVALDADGTLWVQLEGQHQAPVVARLGAPLGRQSVLDAVARGQDAVFVRPQGGVEPVLLALLVAPQALASGALEFSIGREANRLVLRAGAATITLDDAGKVALRGVRILARASEDHRILGRMVRIN